MNPNQIFEDFDRKYQGSFITVSTEGKPAELFQLNRIIHDGSKFPKLALMSDRVGNVILNYHTNARIMFRVPSSTFIQQGLSTYYFTRQPARQWKRGVHSNNTLITDPLAQLEGGWTRARRTVDFTAVRAAFNPVYYPLSQAIDMIKAGYHGVALSRNMAVIKNKKQNLIVFYRLSPIGVVKDGMIIAPGFEKEVHNEVQ